MRMTVKGLEDFSTRLQSLGDEMGGAMKQAVYAGTGAMIEAVKSQIRALPEEEGFMPPGCQRFVVRAAEKRALLTHVGISPIEFDGGRASAAVGFDGYAEDLATKTYPGGLPVPLLARAIESGSSVRRKHPFLRAAANAAKAACEAAMIEAADAAIQKITESE